MSSSFVACSARAAVILSLAFLAVGAVSASAATRGAARTPTHVVKRGESLWLIAARESRPDAGNARIAATVRRIAALNADRLPGGADWIVPGQRLRLPGFRSAPRDVHLTTADWSAGPVRLRSGLHGARSARVREVQSRLASLGFATGRVDGRFGPITDAAVRSFQAASSLAVDGIVGPRTLRALRAAGLADTRVKRRGAHPRHDRSPAQGTTRPQPQSQSRSGTAPRAMTPSAPAPGVATVWIWLPALTAVLAFAALSAVGRASAGTTPEWPSSPGGPGWPGLSGATPTGSHRAWGGRRARFFTATYDMVGVTPPPRPRSSPSAGGAPTLSVVIPTLNEAESLPHVLGRLSRDVNQLIVVDGGSVDGTPELARALRPDAQVIRQHGRGKGDALACGFAHSWGDIIVMLDADGSNDPAEIPRFVDALMSGATYAKGSRFIRGGGSADITRVRRAGNRGLNLLVNTLFGTRYTDLCYGYNAFWHHALSHLELDCAGFEVETLMNIRAAKSGLAIVEVPSFEDTRVAGVSKLNARRDGLRIVRTIIAERLSGGGSRPAGAASGRAVQRGHEDSPGRFS
jgi:hypothetical protein